MNDTLRLSLGDQLDLKWYFSYGITRIERSTIGPQLDSLRARVLGNGCSVHLVVEPDIFEVLRAGGISRILAALPSEQVLVLSLAHGDAGYIATNGGLMPERRWRSVAHLTKTAIRMGQKHYRNDDFGPPAIKWLERFCWSRGSKQTKEATAAEKEARALIDKAELAYMAAAGPKHAADVARAEAVQDAYVRNACRQEFEGVR